MPIPTQVMLEIGTEGIFRLKPPFAGLLPAQTSFKCTATRKLSEIISSGVDPFVEYYEPYGITQAIYDDELAADVTILSLTSSIGQWLYVPTSYVLGYPNVNGVTYTAVMLGVSLGALPNKLSLSALKTAIANLVKDTIGVDVVLKEIAVSESAIIPHSEHVIINATRLASVIVMKTDRQKVIDLQNERTVLLAKVAALETYVEANTL